LHRLNWSQVGSSPLLDPSEMYVVISPKATQCLRIYNPNKNDDRFLYNLRDAQETSPGLLKNFLLANSGMIDFDWATPDTTSAVSAYDDHQICMRDTAGAPMFYMDNNGAAIGQGINVDFVSTVTAADVTANASVELWTFHDNAWEIVDSIPLVAGTQGYTFQPTISGFYNVAFPGLPKHLRNAGVLVNFANDCGFMQTFNIEQLFANATDVDEIRINGNSVKITDIAAPLNAEGAIVGCELFGSNTWLDYLQDINLGTSTSIFDAIADVRGAETAHALIKGKSGYNKVRNRNFRKNFDIDFENSLVEFAQEEVDDEYTYVIAAFSQTAGGVAAGADCLLTNITDIEFIGRNKWNDTDTANIGPLQVEDAQFRLNSAPTGGDNPNWFSTALSWIGGALTAAAPFLGVIPAIGIPIAGGIGAAGIALQLGGAIANAAASE